MQADHIFRNNQPIPYQERYEKASDMSNYGPRLIIHIFNTEGDLRELGSFRNVELRDFMNCSVYPQTGDHNFNRIYIQLERMYNEHMEGPCEDINTEGKGFCNGNSTVEDIQVFLDEFAEENDIILGFTAGFVKIDQALAEVGFQISL